MYRTMILLMVFLNTTAYASTDSMEIQSSSENSVGLGLGIPYGVIGVNADAHILSGLSLSIGIGSACFKGFAYNVGARYFLVPTDYPVRPRISVFYGTNLLFKIDHQDGSQESKTYQGISIGFGMQWSFGKSRSRGFDFDFIYLAKPGRTADELRSEGYSIRRDDDRIKMSFGFRQAF